MPIMRCGAQLIYYAHVPKCAGSAVEDYLQDRFGALAFCDTAHRQQSHPWSYTSPQHIDRQAFARLFPAGFIDASFAIVRHPVARIVSAWHFQLEVEKTVPAGMGFSDWLAHLPESWAQAPYAFDNHTRPMNDIVPEGAEVFYLEHGLDAIIPWLDRITGTRTGARFIGEVNQRGKHGKVAAGKVAPDENDLALITSLYQADFERFGYKVGEKPPLAKAPELSPQDVADRDAGRAYAARPVQKLMSKIRKKL